jgi:hypothetical protein
LVVWVGHADDGEPVDAGEVTRVAAVQRQIVGEGDGGNHRVVGAGRSLASGSTQRTGNLAKATGGGSVEWQGVEVGFGLLEVCLSSGSFLFGRSYEWTYRKLGESYRRDHRLVGERIGLLETSEQDERAGIEYPARHRLEGGIEDLVEILAQPVRV